MTAEPGGIPEAWPLLLTKEQACAFLGGLGGDTFDRICPIAPRDLGVNLLRWSRPQLEDWVAGMPARLRRAQKAVQDDPPIEQPPAELAGQERRQSAVERARERSEQYAKGSARPKDQAA